MKIAGPLQAPRLRRDVLAKARVRLTQHERRSKAENALLDAAAQLFAERGIVDSSLADIGGRAGYSRGLVNHHFGSKAELIERLAHRCQKRFSEWIGPIGGRSGLDGILEIVDAYVRHFEAPTPEGRAMLVMWGAAFPRSSPVDGMVEADRRARAGILQCVSQGKRDGSISKRIDGPAFAVTLLGLLRGVAAQFLTDHDGINMPRARSQCLRFVTQALSPGTPRHG